MRRRPLLAAPLLALPARAATWPERAVTIVSPFPPGQSGDVMARLLAQPLAAAWGQPVVVQNLPGASSTIGVDRVAKAAPDGLTLLISGDAPLVVRVHMDPAPPYDVARDLAPISLLARSRNMILAAPGLGVSTLAEFIALARARPGQLGYGHTGQGFSTHLGMEALKRAAGIDVVDVQYNNGALILPDLRAGRLAVTISSTPAMIDLVRAGELRALAVASGERMPALPEVPTVAEQGFPGFDFSAWWAALAPARTPAEVLARIEADLRAAMAEPATRARFESMGLAPLGGSAAELRAMIPRETARMAGVLGPLGLMRGR